MIIIWVPFFRIMFHRNELILTWCPHDSWVSSSWRPYSADAFDAVLRKLVWLPPSPSHTPILSLEMPLISVVPGYSVLDLVIALSTCVGGLGVSILQCCCEMIRVKYSSLALSGWFCYCVHVCVCVCVRAHVCVLVAQLCPFLCDPIDCSLAGFSVCGILQARILEWVAVPFSRESSPPRNRSRVSLIAGRFFTVWVTRFLLLLQLFVYLSITPVESSEEGAVSLFPSTVPRALVDTQ